MLIGVNSLKMMLVRFFTAYFEAGELQLVVFVDLDVTNRAAPITPSLTVCHGLAASGLSKLNQMRS
jgi:hypothetical protein